MLFVFCLFVEQKTAYEMRISDWSSDVCSSDLRCFSYTDRTSLGFNEPNRISRTNFRQCRSKNFAYCNTSFKNFVSSARKIGRASCRERVCQYVSISVVAVSLKQKNRELQQHSHLKDHK